MLPLFWVVWVEMIKLEDMGIARRLEINTLWEIGSKKGCVFGGSARFVLWWNGMDSVRLRIIKANVSSVSVIDSFGRL